MAIIPPFFLKSVVALGVKKYNGDKHWVGTGFIVGRTEENEPDKSTVYIVTNKHVVDMQPMLFVRFNNAGGIGVKDLPMSLLDNGQKLYSEHPLPDSDVVAIQILPSVIQQNNLELSFFDIDKHTLTLSQMEHTGVSEGSLIYSLGFPMNLVKDITKAPVCRLGCISRIADAFLMNGRAQQYLVDAQVFPGNSGGPIISRPEIISIEGTESNNSAFLIGILSAYIPYENVLISQQTGKPMMVQQENSGLTVVHPVDRIKDVIELEYVRVEQNKKKLLLPSTGNDKDCDNDS